MVVIELSELDKGECKTEYENCITEKVERLGRMGWEKKEY